MREGQKLATEDQVIMLLESSQPAWGLYRKCGFVDVWRGVNCGIVDVCMVWHGELEGWEDGEEVRRRIEGLREGMEEEK